MLNNLEFGEYVYTIDGKRNFTFNVFDWTKETFNNFLIYGDMGINNSQCLDAVETRASFIFQNCIKIAFFRWFFEFFKNWSQINKK